jgi:Zn-dependent protease with chaperone function
MGIEARIKASVDDAHGFSTERLADDKGRIRIAISIGEMLSWGLDEEGFDFCILHELGHHEGQEGWRRRLWSTAAVLCLLGTIALGALKWNVWGKFGDAAGWAAMGLLLAAYVSTMAGLRAEELDADAFAARALGKERALAGARQALEGAEKKESLAAKWLYHIATPFGGTHPSTSNRLSSLAGE